MGCFCKETFPALQQDMEPAGPSTDQPASPARLPRDGVVPAAHDWLAARWLPAPPFQPDPAWHDATDQLPEPPISPAGLGVIAGLLHAQQTCLSTMGLDPAQPDQAAKLARVVRTLNRRMADAPPIDPAKSQQWQQLAALNDEADKVRAANREGSFDQPRPGDPEDTPMAPWRQLLGKIYALAPLIAVARMAKLDFSQPEAPAALAEQIRKLRAVTLPPVEDLTKLAQMIAQNSAISRLQSSLGADPRKHSIERVRAVVQRKVATVESELPPNLASQDGALVGAPPRQPNPSHLINADTIRAAQQMPADTLDKMRWTTPDFSQLDLLTKAAPVASLVGVLQALGLDPVRDRPCGSGCDAGPAR